MLSTNIMNIRDKKLLFNGIVVNVEQMDVQIGDKGWHTFQVVRHPGGAAVLPLHSDGTVTLIRQPRPAIGALTIEIPAGRLSHGEDPAECARRELLEETGLIAGGISSLGHIYPSPGVFDEKIHLFIAEDLQQGESAQEEFEDIRSFRIPLADAIAMATDGRIIDGKTIAALFRATGRKG